jgi:CrcB protein
LIQSLIAVAAGGALGAVARHLSVLLAARLLGGGFPYGTLIVNVVGSLLIGATFQWLLLRGGDGSAELKAFVMVGFLGAFTTYSTFALETVQLLEQAAYGRSLVNMLANLLLCVGAAWLGMLMARL